MYLICYDIRSWALARCVHIVILIPQTNGDRVAIKVFKGGPEFKSLKREIDVVRSLPHHENIVALYTVEEEVSSMTCLP